MILPRKGGSNASKRLVVAFDWNAEFQFLSRFWPKEATRGAIDLYDDALFRGDDLLVLRARLRQASQALADQPTTWQEQIGDQIQPTAQPIFDQADKCAVSEHIDALIAAIDTAITHGGVLEFVGD